LEKPSFLEEKNFRSLGFQVLMMYKDRTQNYDPEIHEEYFVIHPFPGHLIYSHVQTMA